MTHPYREELAGRLPGDLSERLEAIASALPNGGLWDQSVATLREAAAALRQSPSVEEVARVIDPKAWAFRDGQHDAIDKLTGGQSDEEKVRLKANSDMYVRESLKRAAQIDRLYRGSKE